MLREVEKNCKKLLQLEKEKQWNAEYYFKTGFRRYFGICWTGDEFKQAIRSLNWLENFDLIHVETFYVYRDTRSPTKLMVLVRQNWIFWT